MFTGLIEDVGEVVAIQPRGTGRQLTIATALPTDEIAVGDSVAVDGVCLTAESSGAGRFVAVAASETLQRTTLGKARPGRRVHLERALRLGDRLGGHLVQGHVDGVGKVERAQIEPERLVLWLAIPSALLRYVAPKGSLCVDGVSLTVNALEGGRARVDIIPHTAAQTQLGRLAPGSEVNLEVDVLAKYVERLFQPDAPGSLSLETLRTHGFT